MSNRSTSLAATYRTVRELGKLFDKLGNEQHPRGRVLVSYRNAIRALRDILRRQTGTLALFEAQEVLDGLRRDVQSIASETLQAAVTLGQQQATTEYTAWELTGDLGIAGNADMFLDSWMGMVDQQSREALAIILAGGDSALILGDETRQGLLRPEPVISNGARWLTSAAVLTFSDWLSGPIQQTGEVWGKQAIPVIDLRTTNCCLEVAGQVVEFDKPFKLTGVPRFADEMEWSPFHWYCRTSIAMVPMRLAEDELTQRILSDAQVELAEREVARERALETLQRIVELGAKPDGRHRIDDSDEVSELRTEYVKLKRRAGTASDS